MDKIYIIEDDENIRNLLKIALEGFGYEAEGFETAEEGLERINPLHGPRVEAIIKQLENKETPEKKAYVDEEMFAHDDTVKSVTVDGKEYPVTVVTDEVMGARKY